MAVAIQAGTPLAEQLSSILQPKLVDIGWSSGGLDDSVLADYIILMLANGKTQDQIASELATELLSLPPEDTGAQDFAQWLFEQVGILTGTTQTPQDDTQAIPSYDGDIREGQSADQDAEMGDAGDSTGGSHIPTGPKSMRGGRGGRGGRLATQLSRAMDRGDVLHRVRPQSGERIGRKPPTGPRGGGTQRQSNAGVPTGPRAGSAARASQSAQNGVPQQFSQQQQAQLFNMLSQIMGGQIPGMSPLANPQNGNFNTSQGNGRGRPLADRIGGRGGHHKSNGRSQNGDADISMDGAEGASNANGPSPDNVCRFNLRCTNPDCIFAHQSPAAPPGTTVDVSDICTFGVACQNKKCVGRHPSPAQKKAHQAEQECKFFPNCTNPHCPFKHPDMPLCRFAGNCKNADCKFTHLQTPCRFNPCKNPTCPYKHEAGQQQVRTIADMTWTPDKAAKTAAEHVSERKFISEEGQGAEELIVPDAPEVDDVA